MRNHCSVDHCDAPVHGRGWCTKHYLRWYTWGDPNRERPQVVACRVDGCTTPTRSHSVDLCEKHYFRIRRNGDLQIRSMRRASATYRAAHARLEHDKGKARSFPCVDCRNPAHHWSYDHQDPEELTSPEGQPYSLGPAHYSARCAPCHAVFDGTGANQYVR